MALDGRLFVVLLTYCLVFVLVNSKITSSNTLPTDTKTTKATPYSTRAIGNNIYRVHGNITTSDQLHDNNTTSDPHLVLENGEHANHSEDHSDDEHAKGIQLVPVHISHVKYPLVFTLVVIFSGLCKLGFHHFHFLSSVVPESCLLIIVGLIFGVIFYFSKVSETLTLFAPNEFFLFLLPPIILEAAFSLHDRTFAENLGSVLLFAVLGTVLNFFAIGLSLYGLCKAGAMEAINCSLSQLFVFSALIVAVDPVAVLAVFQEVGVNNTLYFLVFGESLLNDGVTVVLYNVMQIINKMTNIDVGTILLGFAKFFVVVLFGTAIGVVTGMLSSFITRFTNTVKVVEPLIIFGFAYLSYLLSELFEFSGIVSIITCGVLQVHYAFHNITDKSRLAIKFFAKVMATASEIIIFLFLGIVTIDPNHDWKTGFMLWTLFLCILFRFIFTYALSIALNYFSTRKVRKIKFDEMFMISYGGLRGAVCFSLVALIDEKAIPMKRLFVTTTLFVIFFTVFIQGGTIKWVVKKLRVTLAQKERDMSISEETNSHVFDHIMAGIEEIIGYTTGTHHIKLKLEHIDNNVIKPKILRVATKSSDLDDISHYYEKLVMKEHFKHLKLGGATLPRVKTEIRHLDSELALCQLSHDNNEENARRRDETIVLNSNGVVMRRNVSFGGNIHTFLSQAMRRARSRLHMDSDDKDVVPDQKQDMVTHLRNKRRKNQQLLHLRNTETSPLATRVNLSVARQLDKLSTRTSQVTIQIHSSDQENDEDSQRDSDDDHLKVNFHL